MSSSGSVSIDGKAESQDEAHVRFRGLGRFLVGIRLRNHLHLGLWPPLSYKDTLPEELLQRISQDLRADKMFRGPEKTRSQDDTVRIRWANELRSALPAGVAEGLGLGLYSLLLTFTAPGSMLAKAR